MKCEDERLVENRQGQETQLNGLATWLMMSSKFNYQHNLIRLLERPVPYGVKTLAQHRLATKLLDEQLLLRMHTILYEMRHLDLGEMQTLR